MSSPQKEHLFLAEELESSAHVMRTVRLRAVEQLRRIEDLENQIKKLESQAHTQSELITQQQKLIADLRSADEGERDV